MISNRSVAFTDAFKRQSVTSERWINLQEVGQQDVATFLTEKAAAGYTIIGATSMASEGLSRAWGVRLLFVLAS